MIARAGLRQRATLRQAVAELLRSAQPVADAANPGCIFNGRIAASSMTEPYKRDVRRQAGSRQARSRPLAGHSRIEGLSATAISRYTEAPQHRQDPSTNDHDRGSTRHHHQRGVPRRRLQGLAVRGGAPSAAAARADAGDGQDRDLRDRLRPVRPAAYRYLRRGGAHQHGAARLRGADRRQDQDAADLLLGRHGRTAQGAGQRAEQGDARHPPGQAAVERAGPVLERISELRRAQQRPAACLSRPVRLCLRVLLGDRMLQGRASSMRPCSGCSPPTTR